VKYGLVIEDAASVAIAAMPEVVGELFTMACFDACSSDADCWL